MPRKKKNTAAQPAAETPFPLQPPEQAVPEQGCPVVGIGASAGGLEALEGFVTNLPAETNMAFVIIQHLSPKHKSIMAELLQKHTPMPVVEIADGTRVMPNHVYLNPPDKQVILINHILQLMEPVRTQGITLQIDAFFRSLAEDRGEKAIGIVLSGTGSDGTLGVKAIKGAGGMAMVQAEAQARYDGMPRSAINTGLVDYVLPVEQMSVELLKYVQHPYIENPVQTGLPEDQFRKHVHKIFALIRSATSHDFSNYKPTTIRRRIERRMAIHQLDHLEDYVRYLQNTPAEVGTLFKEMLIGVTNFFRDPEAFDILAARILPELVARKAADAPLRIWVPGCATGEEAYSLAILLAEMMERLKKHCAVQIFASDLDAAAIESARLAIYPESIAADVSPERLQRFFVKEDNTYKVKKPIREMVVFAVQNVIKDPPFSRLDLISCRNLLIYMGAVLQKRLLPMFHYALLPEGILFLGSSESIGEFTDLFASANVKWKIFTRKDTGLTQSRDYPSLSFLERQPPIAEPPFKKSPVPVDLRHVAERIALESYTAPCVLINEKADILYLLGPVDRYLRFTPGEPSVNLLEAAREGLRYKLAAVIQEALKQKTPVTVEGLRVKTNGDFLTVKVLVRPLTEPIPVAGLLMVVFTEHTPPAEAALSEPQAQAEIDPRISALEQELQSTKEYLQTTIEELETSNEELKSTNEELQSMNEEMQSTNEELETSKEELQSTNEELVTVNTELQHKVEELSQANNDINNLLASTDIGTIFLDTNLRIKRFTPAVAKIFNLITSDVGRPICDITTRLDYQRLEQDAHQVLDTLNRQEIELHTKDGVWYIMRLAPYRTLENVIDGVVLTFMNVTAIKQAELAQQAARLYAESILATVREPLLIVDAALMIRSANAAFYRTFQVKPEETESKRIDELGNGQWNIPQLRHLLEEILPQRINVEDYQIEHEFPLIGTRTMLLNARRIEQIGDQPPLILLAFADVTEKHSA